MCFYLSIYSALELPAAGMVALIGGGGKTSLLYALGREIAEQNQNVLLTTSTHLLPPDPGQVSALLIDPAPAQITAAFRDGSVVMATGPCTAGKLSPPGKDFFSWCKGCAHFVLVEADGAKRHPFKAPAPHEPALPAGTDLVIGVAGIDALFQPISAACHRPALVSTLLGLPPDALLTPEGMAEIILSPAGYQKNLTQPFRLVLNKCDTAERIGWGEAVRHALRQQGVVFPILLTALARGK